MWPHLTAVGNVSYALRRRKLSAAETTRSANDALDRVGLAHLGGRYPHELSGGEQQRVALARAVAARPRLLLFDEPLSNLDAQLRSELRVEIKRLHQRLGSTIIYVTHDQIEALTLADRIAVMRDRRIQQLGTPQEVYQRPANKFVATFVGSPAMSFVGGQLAEGPGFSAPGLNLPLGGYAFGEAPRHGRAVELGVRPEHIELAPGAENATLAPVEVVEPMGSDLLAWTRIGGAPVSVRLPAETRVAVGDKLPLVLPLSRLNFFDTATGGRL